MVWFRVDDVLPFHARVIEAGNAAMGLWVRAGALSAGQLTDGFITAATARTLGSPREIKRLVEVGLWVEVDGGYQFHAWAEDGSGTKRQPTRAEVEAARKAERDRKAAQRAKPKDTHPDDPPRPPGVPVGQPARHRPDVGDVSEYPVPSRPDPVTDSHVSPSSHVPDREAETDDDDGSRIRSAYWRAWKISNPTALIALIAQAVDRPVDEQQAVGIVAGILAKSKTAPRFVQAYVESSVRQSWAEIQRDLDTAAVAA
jgi:hypothetical protein